MKLSTRSRYGTRMMVDLAQHYNEGPVQAGDIAKRQDISLKYLEQLIIPLKASKFVKSVRGPKGGHCLAISPKKITLAQIIRVFEKEHTPNEPPNDTSTYSEYQDSLIRDAWNEAIEAFYNRLEKVTLADLSIGTTKKLWTSSDLLIIN